uniref:Uncharacterized protein n=1 Tax=Rhinopithecus bieti TaxID=61621 RepID=A0A2K6KS55_RHIBE
MPRTRGSSPGPVEGWPRRPSPLPARPVLRPLRARPAAAPAAPALLARLPPLRPHRPRRPAPPLGRWPGPAAAPGPRPEVSARPPPGLIGVGRTWSRGASPGALAGGPPGGPGSRGEEAKWAGNRGPAAADGETTQRAVQTAETRGAAATPPLALEGPVQSHYGTPALTQGPQSPRNGAQLGACTRPVDVRDSGGRPLPPPDTLASAGDFLCTM